MAEAKTLPTDASVADFLVGVADPARRTDAQALCDLMTQVTGAAPVMWGTSIVGFGSYQYRYASGQQGQWPAVGLSPRKQNLTVYLPDGLEPYGELLSHLGRHTTGRSCLYLKRLSDVDESVLRQLVHSGYTRVNGQLITTGGPG